MLPRACQTGPSGGQTIAPHVTNNQPPLALAWRTSSPTPYESSSAASSRRSACASSGQCSRPPRAARQLSAWQSIRAAPARLTSPASPRQSRDASRPEDQRIAPTSARMESGSGLRETTGGLTRTRGDPRHPADVSASEVLTITPELLTITSCARCSLKPERMPRRHRRGCGSSRLAAP